MRNIVLFFFLLANFIAIGQSENGWTVDAEQKLISALSERYREDITLCLVQKIEKTYELSEVVNWTPLEEKEKIDLFMSECTKDVGINDEINDEDRDEALSLIGKEKYSEAMTIYEILIEEGVATDWDYNNLAWCYIATKQYRKAIKYLEMGIKKDDTNLALHGNLANCYLLTGNIERAKEIYLLYKNENIDEETSFVDALKEDFKFFKKKGITSPYFEEVLELMK